MFNFFKKESDVSLEKEESFIEIACLLVHASKIDEQYTDQEKKIIEKTLLKFGAKVSDISNIISKAEDIEKNSNQILDFTRKIKDVDKEKKLIIIKSLWEIIYSDTK